MPKMRRVLNLSRIFGIALCLGSALILFLLRDHIRIKSASTDGGGQHDDGRQHFSNGTRALIVDVDCLGKLARGQNCQFPISVAIPFGHQFEEVHFLRTHFFLENLAERNFWLFHNAANWTAKIATKKFQTKRATLRLEGDQLAELEVPAEMASFARAWQQGRFLDCLPELRRPANGERLIPLAYLDRVAQFANLLGQFNATAFIFSGTLLGWRRECSLIPHTNDIDFGLFHDQHSDALLRAILTSPTFIVHWVLGRLRDSFELSVNVDGFKIDLFYVYNTQNATFVGGMRPEKRQRLRWHYPRVSGEICAGELHGRLVHLLCDYEKILESDYGHEDWKKDIQTNAFVWDKAHKNKESLEVYSDEEWPNVFLLVKNKMERFEQAKVDQWMANINKTA